MFGSMKGTFTDNEKWKYYFICAFVGAVVGFGMLSNIIIHSYFPWFNILDTAEEWGMIGLICFGLMYYFSKKEDEMKGLEDANSGSFLSEKKA